MKNRYNINETRLGAAARVFEPDSLFAQELFDYEDFFSQLLATESPKQLMAQRCGCDRRGGRFHARRF